MSKTKPSPSRWRNARASIWRRADSEPISLFAGSAIQLTRA
jgi:hypothetical protein